VASYHVCDSRLEVAKKGLGLVSLDLAVLDGFPPQEVVHLDRKDGRRAALILAAEISCTGGTADALIHATLFYFWSHTDAQQRVGMSHVLVYW